MTGPVDGSLDESFLQELTSVMGNGNNTSSTTAGYSASSTPAQTASGAAAPTSSNDFFHKMPCQKGSMFCIDVKTVPGGNITL